MYPYSPYVKAAGASRFVAGGLPEAEELFGTPLPVLPDTERDEGREVVFVHVHAPLRAHLHRFLDALLAQIGILPSGRGGDAVRIQTEYEAALVRVLRSVRAADRRQGLLNLFWLAHSLEAAEHIRRLEARDPALRRAKQSVFPVLQSFYRSLDPERRRPRPDEPEAFAAVDNPSLVSSIIDDGFAFTELTLTDVDLNLFLSSNKRYRVSPESFFEIQQILVAEAERRLRQGDRGLLARAARHLPGLPRDQYLKPASLVKIVLNGHLLPYLLADPWGVAGRLTTAPVLRAETERRRGTEVLDAFQDLATGLRRFEIVSHLRDQVSLLGAGPTGGQDLEDKAARGLRVHEFGESAQVLNTAVNATVLFLDLRGFTKTSEGQISERDLTRELYAVFDDFVPIVERFGGTVDKYLGDGMMVTWGTGHADPLDPLNALRTAVLCQESLRGKREAGRTYYKMGIAIHFGRAHLARFLAGQGAVQATVIGRNVNLAGRLSSGSRRPLDTGKEPAPRASGLRVSVDAEGVLVNEGIVITRDTLGQLERHVALVHDEGAVEYEDEEIDRRLLIRYAGDAKFKGVGSSLPVYELDYELRS